MILESWVVLIILALVVGALVWTRFPPDVILMAGLTLALAVPVPAKQGWRLGVVSPEQAFSGFSNTGMLTIGVLFVVVAGLRETGAVDWIVQAFLGRPGTLRAALGRIMFPVATVSAFLNNTPIVAMLVPAVTNWSKSLGQAPSKLMLPLSYSAILGGSCTLIGSSTNLIVHGLMISEGLGSVGMFEVARIGLPCALVGLAFLMLVGPWLLPERSSAVSNLGNPREYTAEMMVEPDSPLVGKKVKEAGLRSLPGAFLVEVVRGPGSAYAVSPEERLQAEDRLIFTGVVESIRDLQKRPGLIPATEQIFKLDSPRYGRRLFEAVVSRSCPIAGQTIRDGRFRNHYGAVVIAVAREGQRVEGRIGDIVLTPGDTLLLEARTSFLSQYQNSRDFLLIHTLADSTPRRRTRAGVALAVMGFMVLLASSGLTSMLVAALLAAGCMLGFRCCSIRDARRSVDWSLLVVVGAALGLGKAVEQSGLAQSIASFALGWSGGSVVAGLMVIYSLTWLLTELLTNSAAVALCFPIALEASRQLGVGFTPFAFLIMVAGSSSFASPLGYQTNLMVYGPGGYRFGDYLRIGLPLSLVVGVTAISASLWWIR